MLTGIPGIWCVSITIYFTPTFNRNEYNSIDSDIAYMRKLRFKLWIFDLFILKVKF
jgi:hypothetical protein